MDREFVTMTAKERKKSTITFSYWRKDNQMNIATATSLNDFVDYSQDIIICVILRR